MLKGQSIDAFIDAYWWNRPVTSKDAAEEIEKAGYIRGSVTPEALIIHKTVRKKPGMRTWTGLLFLFILVLPALYMAYHYTNGSNYLLFGVMLVFAAMLPFFLIFEGRKPRARELVVLAVLTALGVAGRGAFYMIPNFKPVAAIVILTAVSFGSEAGFLNGCLIMLISDVFMGMGPWTPWQMFSFGMIGFIAGMLFHSGMIKVTKLTLCIYGFFSVIILFGGIMNPASVLMSYGTLTKADVLAFYISGFPMDVMQGAATVIFLWFLSRPLLEKIERVKIKYGLILKEDWQ